ncbi:nitroreductase family deazaflavin-dependent oxidoreductase [Hoyosella sp. YIM 151337]|uniref:nitroreductase family deazaflavin-dependent oxidoreductase n=1 Tax=Hoyosella sp. YIM 151337 TaxID=2992742 RepID=UPI0027DF9371|nr:nitroreductase family deazaflavin-dependent oxidoreductase [Hoyosella sp. YIM 151337]
MPLPAALARFNRHATNKVAAMAATRMPGMGLVVHRGRHSGNVYTTPVNVFRDGDDYRIALTYGTKSDWVRNVVAARGCVLETRGRRIQLTDPVIERDRAAAGRRSWSELSCGPSMRPTQFA